MKYLKIIIIVVIIIIMLLFALLLLNINKTEEPKEIVFDNIVLSNNVNTNNVISNNTVLDFNLNTLNNSIEDEQKDGETVDGKVKTLQDYSIFLTIQDAIQNYIDSVNGENRIAVLSMLSTKYVKNNGVNVQNVLDYTRNVNGTSKFRAVNINYVSGTSTYQYGVYGNLLKNDGSIANAYFIINLNKANLRYSIIPQENNISKLSDLKLEIQQDEVEPNEYNKVKFVNANDEIIIQRIVEDFKNLCLNYTESSYKLIDVEYKVLRFNDYADYYTYLKNNANKINNLKALAYKKTNTQYYTEYKFEDTYGNCYIIRLSDIMKYTIILDDYTLDENKSYSNLSNENKVKNNIIKIIKMINTCDYSHLYRYLDEMSKISTYSTQTSFENYIKTNYFENNIISNINITYEQESSSYKCELELKEDNRVSADTKIQTIIMKLGTGTNFEISF